MAGVRLSGLSKRYGSIVAVDRVDLDVADGELMVILGPSGSGKTTLLRLVAGLESASDGSVVIGERDVTAVPPGKRDISMVFQNYALFPHLDVAANIGFGLVARHTRPPELHDRVRRAAALVGCGHVLERYPDALSGGERQRVALARAICREPRAFLLDEPLSNLDAQLRVQMRAELRALQQRLGATMLYVTHDQQEGLLLGDRVAVLDRGAVQQVGTPDEVYRRPANRFVAEFVGSPPMNVFPATVGDGRLTAGPFVFPVPPAATRLDGTRLELGVRPEHLTLSAEPPDGRAVRAPVEVRLVESAASETYVHAVSGERSLIIRTGGDARPAAGSTVFVETRLEMCSLFDADTGAAVAIPQ